MKYTIIGSGPTGLSLAYILALNNIEVILIEQDNQLGASWNSQWKDNLYFSENSPRVFSYKGNAIKLMKSVGLKQTDYENIYGNLFETNLKLIKFIYKYFEFMDYFIFLISMIKYKIVNENITVYEWMVNSKLSLSAKKAIKIISILICDTPNNTNVNDFFGSISSTLPKQMKEPNKWHKIIELFIIKKGGKIYKNTRALCFYNDHKTNLINRILVQNILNNKKYNLECDKIFLCTQSNGIYPILKNSNKYIKNNWMPIRKMKIWHNNTFYIGFGFQLHFDKVVEYNKKWCWSCEGDWTVIILPVSNWLKTISKDKSIKTVWSCCIVDMDTKSKRINKTANECRKTEIINECMYQIKTSYNIPNPKIITLSDGLKKFNNKWISKNTGFTKNIYGNLNMKGYNIDNLFALGCFTKNNKNHVSNMTGAIDATANYIDKYEDNIKNNIFV